MGETARRTAVATLVVIGLVAAALALWKLKVLIALIFLAFIVAAAMRPGIDALRRRRVPRALGLLLHYAAIAGVVALLLWFAVPRALDQVQQALKNVPTTATEAHVQAKHSSGIKRRVLQALEKRLKRLPSGSSVLHPAVEATKTAFEVLIAIFFVFATAAYWIFERERAIGVVTSLLPRPKRRVVRDTWDLIDAKLGAFVRGQLLLIAFVASVLSLCFRLVHEPYWLLVGCFAGIVEIVPVIGPLSAGVLAIGVGLTASLFVAVGAGLCVLGVRLLEDYIVVPRVLGHAVGLSPLLVLIGVTATPLLFGGFYVLLAVPIVAVLVTLVDVIVRDVDPAEQEVPAVLFPAKDAEG